jgi:Transglutaminase-like superfamily
MDRLLKFWSSTRREKWLLCEASILLLLSSLSVRIIPFKRIHSFLCKHYGYVRTHACEASSVVGDIKLIDLSVLRAANGLPWNNLCLSRSIAAFIMFRRRGIPAVLLAGVKVLEDSSLIAHAWVNAGDEASEKNPQNSEFSVVVKIGQAI